MRNRLAAALGAALLVCAGGARVAAAPPAADAGRKKPAASLSAPCDYACLTGFVERYLKALAAHHPAQLPLAPHVRFTENTIPLHLGDALWGTFSGLGSYRLTFADPEAGEVAFEGSIRENGAPAILFLRLRVAGGKITEIETLVHRNADDARALEKLGQPNPVWLQPLARARRAPRAAMIHAVNLYFAGILHSNGDSVPFDPRCNRILDGYQDTNNPTAKGWFDQGAFRPDAMGIGENMSTGIWAYIHSIEPRRFAVVDETKGIVLGMVVFNHPGNVLWAQVPGVGRVPMPPIVTHPSAVPVAEFFKVQGGKIRQIEGVTIALPYGAPSGWPSPSPAKPTK